VYHVRAVTPTDVVRAGTKDVAKIFQILYDINAVSGPGSVTYLGATSEALSKNRNAVAANAYLSAIENSPTINASNISTSTLHTSDNFSDSAVGSTLRSLNGNLDLESRFNSDAISVGSNDSGEVSSSSSQIDFCSFLFISRNSSNSFAYRSTIRTVKYSSKDTNSSTLSIECRPIVTLAISHFGICSIRLRL
jgi:hypothetical protein